LLRATDGAPRPQRPHPVVAGRIGAADQLDDDIRGLEDPVEVALGAPEHPGDLRAPARGRLDGVRALEHEVVEGPADRPLPEEPDPNRVTHNHFPTAPACRGAKAN